MSGLTVTFILCMLCYVGALKSSLLCVTVSHDHHVYLLFWKGYCVILCKGKNLCCACAMTSSRSMMTSSVSGRDELHTKYQSDDLKLRDNWEDRVVDWRDIIEIDLKWCDWAVIVASSGQQLSIENKMRRYFRFSTWFNELNYCAEQSYWELSCPSAS